MKYPIKTLLIVLLAVPITTFSQTVNWVNLNTGTTKKINDILFLSADTGYIVGDDYLFKKTTDGGLIWTDLPTSSIGERAGNNGNIVAIAYHETFSQLKTGLVLLWEQPFYPVVTDNEGLSYSSFGYYDSLFCQVSGIFASDWHSGGYRILSVYGETCNGGGVATIYYDGPFITSSTLYYSNNGGFTDFDIDPAHIPYGQSIFSHEDGNLLTMHDTIDLDSTGISALAYAGNQTWYATSYGGTPYMYISMDSGLTFQADTTFPITFFHSPFAPYIFNDMEFNSKGIGLMGAGFDGLSINGSIVVKNANGWNEYMTNYPINAVEILNETAYAAGDSGLVMKASQITTIREINSSDDVFKLYPNPATETVNVLLKDDFNVEGIKLQDINGKQIRNYHSNHQVLDVGDLSAGIYFIQLQTSDGIYTKKLIIKP